jgi:hypothetical protein
MGKAATATNPGEIRARNRKRRRLAVRTNGLGMRLRRALAQLRRSTGRL